MESRRDILHRIIELNRAHVARTSVNYDADYLNKILANIYSPGPSFQYILDMNTKSFDYVSEGVKEVLGRDARTFQLLDYVNMILPGEMGYLENCERIAGYFLFKFIDGSEIPYYKVSYQIKMLDHTGSPALFLRQSIAVSCDEQHRISKVFTNQSRIDHITPVKNEKISFLDVRGVKSYYNIAKISDLTQPRCRKKILTARETQILKLLSEGYSSKEIADILYISYNTVRTHRNNILKNTECASMSEVISYSIKEGIV